MNKAQQLLHKADRFQQDRPWLSLPVATWKKFGDDQAGNLAALIAYYAFVSLFPLLLVFVTILDIALKGNAALRNKLLNSALGQYPVIGDQLKPHGSLSGTGLALAIGIILALLGGLGVANAMQNALNSAWEVPMANRPGFPWATLRSLGLIGVIGPGMIATIALSSIAGGAGHLGGGLAQAAAAVVALILNIGLFWLGFRLATAKEVATRDMWLSAVLAAVAWQLLQLLGGYFVAHQLHNNSAYGIFGVVLGLLAWLYLEAQITLYVVELNVVQVRRLWPRSLAPPPLTEADQRAYEMYAQVEQRHDGVEVSTQTTAAADQPQPGSKASRESAP
jgi:membrane protein